MKSYSTRRRFLLRPKVDFPEGTRSSEICFVAMVPTALKDGISAKVRTLDAPSEEHAERGNASRAGYLRTTK